MSAEAVRIAVLAVEVRVPAVKEAGQSPSVEVAVKADKPGMVEADPQPSKEDIG